MRWVLHTPRIWEQETTPNQPKQSKIGPDKTFLSRSTPEPSATGESGSVIAWKDSHVGHIDRTFLDQGMTRRNINDVFVTFIGTFQMITDHKSTFQYQSGLGEWLGDLARQCRVTNFPRELTYF